ncbi:MAG: DNA repair protein RadA [bacterium]|nr:DNA repair protein RadA [bacterium]
MPKTSSIYICQQCGFKSPQFLGKCPECGTWNSLVETVEEGERVQGKGYRGRKQELPKVVNLAHIEKENYQRLSTTINEFDRVLGGPASPDGSQGGGIVKGSVVLVSGDPGVGKSTLLTQLALNTNLSNKSNLTSALYVAGEESAQQIKIRAERIKKEASLAVLNEVDVDLICGVIAREKPALVIIDSIQTLETQDLTSASGSVGQVRESAHRLQRLAKELHVPIFLVGHVTKEGTIAGPKTLEHVVDVVLSLEGETNSNFRVLRATKNRFGPTDEVGVFEMEESGMREVDNPSELFLAQKVEAPGSAVAVTMAGLRPLLVEIQALVTKSFLPAPRRVGLGVDNNRLQLLVAVLSKRLNLPLFDQDVFVNVTGGLKVTEPAADLAICLAIISSLKDKVIPKRVVFTGEVGLLGELRNIRSLDKRIKEAKKLGFTQVISPENTRSLAEVAKLVLK